jgi:predicted  nucleic acid-binding Zn-ribbon protein
MTIALFVSSLVLLAVAVCLLVATWAVRQVIRNELADLARELYWIQTQQAALDNAVSAVLASNEKVRNQSADVAEAVADKIREVNAWIAKLQEEFRSKHPDSTFVN